VSQLGFLTVMLGFGTRDAALAGLALLIGHALFKSSLFLVVGVIDRQLSTRDIRELSGLEGQAPVMATFSVLAVGPNDTIYILDGTGVYRAVPQT
jgi:multicomponent Na+:H+ antiporter subunit A